MADEKVRIARDKVMLARDEVELAMRKVELADREVRLAGQEHAAISSTRLPVENSTNEVQQVSAPRETIQRQLFAEEMFEGTFEFLNPRLEREMNLDHPALD
jgi:hypothetical protein